MKFDHAKIYTWLAPNINVYSPIFQWKSWPFFQPFFNFGIWLVAVNPRKLISKIWISKKKIRRNIIRLIRQNYGKLIQVFISILIGWPSQPIGRKYQFENLPYEYGTIAAMFPRANRFRVFFTDNLRLLPQRGLPVLTIHLSSEIFDKKFSWFSSNIQEILYWTVRLRWFDFLFDFGAETAPPWVHLLSNMIQEYSWHVCQF